MPNHTNVIQFPSPWKFFDYLEGDGNPIQDWYLGLSEDGRNIFDAILKLNSKADHPLKWLDCKMLQGDARPFRIWEWRFFADDVQQRLFGVFGSGRKEAVFLIGCYHKQKRTNPPDAVNTAIRRAKVVIEGRATVYARQIEQDL